MSFDGKLLKTAIILLDKRKSARAAMFAARRAKIYGELPRVEQIDRELVMTVTEAIGAALKTGADPSEAIRRVSARNLTLQAERAELLVGNGYEMDWLDEKPFCAKCNDTGYSGGKPCSCLVEIYKREQTRELSDLLKLGEETFDTFRMEYYDDSGPWCQGRYSAREKMEMVYETCLEYAMKFGSKSTNLYMNGPTGLGKTFLSTCIAKVVSDKGYSVVYDTAASVFSRFEASKFSRDDVEAESDVARYLNCDLLILDDLGTEMTTSFVAAAFYTIVNTRLSRNKKTIISSNLGPDELERRYSPQIASRIMGEYLPLTFVGEDIRLQKKENRN